MRLIILVLSVVLLASCSSKDKQQLLGKWYNDDHWFEFHDESKYSGGRATIPLQTKEDYVLEPSDNKLTFYTDKESESYYLIYKFIGTDTLVLTNSMNVTSVPAKYYRK